MKKKVKICMNRQCTNRVNKPDAAVCVGCGNSFGRINWKRLSDEEIEEILNPKTKQEPVMEETVETQEPVMEENGETQAPVASGQAQEYIVCPNCGKRMVYTVMLEICDECGEYVADQLPVCDSKEQETVQEVSACTEVTAMQSLDGRCRITFSGNFMKIGRHAEGGEYFESAAKRKVCREHAIVQKIDDAWHISCCKREDRNYSGGVANPIFINNRMLGRDEQYRLQPGDEIGFAELDKSDPMAAFFRAE